MRSVLDIRSVQFENDEDLEKLCDCEWILDCFDSSDRTSLEQEIKTGKEKRPDQLEFERAVCAWKV